METAREGPPAPPAYPHSLQLLTHALVEEVSGRGGDASRAKGIFSGCLTDTNLPATHGTVVASCRRSPLQDFQLHRKARRCLLPLLTQRQIQHFSHLSTPSPKRTGATRCFQADWEGDASVSQHHIHLRSFLHATHCFTLSSNPSHFRHRPNQTQPEVRFTLQHPTLC